MRLLIAVILIGITIIISSFLNITSQLTGTANVTIGETVTATLPVSSVIFGTMSLNEVNDTEDGNPGPFILQNDGNVFINVTINATQLWNGTGATGTSSYFQFKSAENETGSVYDPDNDLVTTWTNMPINNDAIKAVNRVDYNDSKDTIKIHIKLTVPPDEPAGDKISTITLTVSQA